MVNSCPLKVAGVRREHLSGSLTFTTASIKGMELRMGLPSFLGFGMREIGH